MAAARTASNRNVTQQLIARALVVFTPLPHLHKGETLNRPHPTARRRGRGHGGPRPKERVARAPTAAALRVGGRTRRAKTADGAVGEAAVGSVATVDTVAWVSRNYTIVLKHLFTTACFAL